MMQLRRKRQHLIVFALALAGCSGAAMAGVSAEEAQQLGTTLTAWGAEVAGNKEGSIPAYTGGLRKPPAEFKPASGIYPDPFKDEKPLLTITPKNAAQYADKLSEGQKLLLTRYPDFRMDIYPTHRTMALPEAVAEATIKNATTAATNAAGDGIKGASGGLPFPIPKTGYEVMWNHLMTYMGQALEYNNHSFYVDQNGRRVLTAASGIRNDFPYYQPNNPERDKHFLWQQGWVIDPPGQSGQVFMTREPIDYSTVSRRAWQYVPGQRRVKVVPELAYDSPYPGGSGLQTMDDINLFQGRMDRYSFKLVGKREMYIPYNMYKLYMSQQTNKPEKAMDIIGTAKYLNPDYMRWELHRVWVVEAELLPGKRHIYKKRVFYFDEDGYGAGMADQYDSADKLLRYGLILPMQMYDRDVMLSNAFMHYDFSTNVYMPAGIYVNGPVKSGLEGPGSAGVWSNSDWSPDAMGRGNVR